jgi:excisionase family DNA binding protein
MSTGLGDVEALCVSPRRAARMLDLGLTRTYELLNSGELRSFKDGKSRRVIVESMREYIGRKLAETADEAA